MVLLLPIKFVRYEENSAGTEFDRDGWSTSRGPSEIIIFEAPGQFSGPIFLMSRKENDGFKKQSLKITD